MMHTPGDMPRPPAQLYTPAANGPVRPPAGAAVSPAPSWPQLSHATLPGSQRMPAVGAPVPAATPGLPPPLRPPGIPPGPQGMSPRLPGGSPGPQGISPRPPGSTAPLTGAAPPFRPVLAAPLPAVPPIAQPPLRPPPAPLPAGDGTPASRAAAVGAAMPGPRGPLAPPMSVAVSATGGPPSSTGGPPATLGPSTIGAPTGGAAFTRGPPLPPAGPPTMGGPLGGPPTSMPTVGGPPGPPASLSLPLAPPTMGVTPGPPPSLGGPPMSMAGPPSVGVPPGPPGSLGGPSMSPAASLGGGSPMPPASLGGGAAMPPASLGGGASMSLAGPPTVTSSVRGFAPNAADPLLPLRPPSNQSALGSPAIDQSQRAAPPGSAAAVLHPPISGGVPTSPPMGGGLASAPPMAGGVAMMGGASAGQQLQNGSLSGASAYGPPPGPQLGPPTRPGLGGPRRYPAQANGAAALTPGVQNMTLGGPIPPQGPPQPGQMPPQPQPAPSQGGRPAAPQQFGVLQGGFNRMWGTETIDLLQQRAVLPAGALEAPRVILPQEHLNSANCSPDIFRSTLTRVPESASVLQKSRLPFGILIHPFKDLPSLPVVQCNTIVRCRSCRTYINPFVYFIDQRRWKCNLCYRANDLPEEFQYDPVSKTYGDPSRRPECKSSTIEFIAPSEYMVRPPQPACYLFVLDVSHAAVQSGYLSVFCQTLLDELDRLPGDSRTQIGFITYDESVHFYDLSEELTQPRMMVVGDVDDIFLPSPDGLLVQLSEARPLVQELLSLLPDWFQNNHSTRAATGAALQAAYKLVYPVGGRITAVVASLPSRGPGALASREDPNNRAGAATPHLGPATDFYKKLALDCSSQQVAVDLFCCGGAYTDIATLAGVSQFSGGSVHHYPGVHLHGDPAITLAFERALRRYLTRKIGFEAVMRIRCTRGLSLHTFHGNFFVRSTDLLSLPNVSPDAGYGIQVAIEEALNDTHTACFQAALLYTSSRGERRIRVHTLCLPVTPNVHEVIQGADQEAVVGLLAKMAVDRALAASLPDAREAIVTALVDALGAYRATLSAPGAGLEAPQSLRLLPCLGLALLKHPAFRSGLSTKLDERAFAMLQLKCLPLMYLTMSVYPNLYALHLLSDEGAIEQEEVVIPQPARLPLSAEHVDSSGVYLLDSGDCLYVLVGSRTAQHYLRAVFQVDHASQLPPELCELPDLETDDSRRLHSFVDFLQGTRPFAATLRIFRDDSKQRHLFYSRLVEDRSESAFSYVEFLQHLRSKVR